MLIRLGYEMVFEVPAPAPMLLVLALRPEREPSVRRAGGMRVEPEVPVRYYADGFGNRCRRFTLPPGATTLRYDAQVDVSGEPDEVVPTATQFAVEDLPDDVLLYTLASRYCLSDALSATAWHLFGDAPLGWGRVQAVCDWLHTNIRYGLYSTPLTTAVDIEMGSQ